jgi:hypothetical protein
MTPAEMTPLVPEEGHTHHHGHATGYPFLDKAMPISALLVSMISLGVAVHHGGIMNEMARNNERAAEASVWPFIELDSGNTRGSDTGTIYYDLANKGVGPARIESFEFFFRGRSYTSAQQLLLDCCFDGLPKDQSVRTKTGLSAPAVIAAKEANLVFELPRTPGTASVWDQFERHRRAGAFSAKGCYCSVFDKCWTTDFHSATRTEVASCPVAKVQFQGLNSEIVPPAAKP